MFIRIFEPNIPYYQSAFLWGARNTGKSTFLKNFYPGAVYYDLLQTDTHQRLLVSPHLFREEILALPSEKIFQPIIVDEIQKIPILLDEIHWLIEHKKLGFILCGSSARKLRRGAANLLGGRAWSFNFYPLVYKEIPNFNLLRAFNHGLLPSYYLSDYPTRSLRAYIQIYLKEEIQEEGLVRNLPGFARFLDVVGFTHGEMINYTNVARDCAIDAKTVKEYYQILVDTLIGYFVYPFFKKIKRDLITTTPKFYLFDVGVAHFLTKRQIQVLKGSDAGRALEHFIFMEITAYVGLNELDDPIHYWRSKSGLEVDFVLAQGSVAIEVKINNAPELQDLNGLIAFCEDYQPRYALVVCQAPKKRLLKTKTGFTIQVLPWQEFIENLWNKMYF
jgi:uncharacterized protein